ncbi:hypothetical protein F5Y06DRAFT_295277 [Hypoxylon sp. FL0890]|nr:hypothetical protein F5Y06DRAFT_295277 [Hypoxylon sp. FL0890]
MSEGSGSPKGTGEGQPMALSERALAEHDEQNQRARSSSSLSTLHSDMFRRRASSAISHSSTGSAHRMPIDDLAVLFVDRLKKEGKSIDQIEAFATAKRAVMDANLTSSADQAPAKRPRLESLGDSGLMLPPRTPVSHKDQGPKVSDSPPEMQGDTEMQDVDQGLIPRKAPLDRVPGPFFTRNAAVLQPRNLAPRDIMALWSERHGFGVTRLNAKARQMIESLSISILEGRAKGRYVCWKLRSMQFWDAAGLNSRYKPYASRMTLEKAKPVYVDLVQGGPIGEFMFHFCSDSRRVIGLFIQMFGLPNEVPCRCCVRRFRSSETDLHSGVWPFFGCRSMPGVAGWSCGMCCYSIEAHLCDFRDSKLKHFRARRRREPPLLEDLNPGNSPESMTIEGPQLLTWADRYVESLESVGEQ